MRTILFTTLIAICGCATDGGNEVDDTLGGKADGASRPSGVYTNPAPHAGELETLTLTADHTFARSTVIECALGAIECEPIVATGTYKLTHSSDEHFIRFYREDGRSLDRYQWELSDGNLELERDGWSSWFEMNPVGAKKICGGFRGALCDDGEYCDFGTTNECGMADRAGVCKAIPQVCPEVYAPVCGCDNQTYSNECDANRAGLSVRHAGDCN